MFSRVVYLSTASAVMLNSVLLAELCSESEVFEERCVFDEQIELASGEFIYSESETESTEWDCCGKDVCASWNWGLTIKPIYWLNAHQGEPIGQNLKSAKAAINLGSGGSRELLGIVQLKAGPPATATREGGPLVLEDPDESLADNPYSVRALLVNWTPTDMVHIPIYWGQGGSVECIGEVGDGSQFSLSFLGFYSKKDWQLASGEGDFDFTMLPTYLSATPFLPLTRIRVQEDGRGLVYFDDVSLTEKNWLFQGRAAAGAKVSLTSSVEIGGLCGFSGLYSTWDRKGKATDVALDPPDLPNPRKDGKLDPVYEIVKDNTVAFTNNNTVYGGGGTLGISLSVGSGCGYSFYGEGAATLYLAQEKASRVVRYSLLDYDFTGTDYVPHTPAIPKIDFLFPKMWKVFPMFDLNVGIEVCCDGGCASYSIRLGWEQHLAIDMFTDFVVQDGAYPEAYHVTSNDNDMMASRKNGKIDITKLQEKGGHEIIESVCVQEYRAVSTSYFFGGPTVSVSMFF